MQRGGGDLKTLASPSQRCGGEGAIISCFYMPAEASTDGGGDGGYCKNTPD